MADPLAPTEDAPKDADTQGTAPAALVRGAPEVAPLDRAMARARAEAALFGDAAPVKVGRYTLIERAGAGGMGVVWSAWDPDLNRAVALKLASSGDDHARARARDEGRALAKLSHPNVVPIYDVFEAPEGVFLVIELVAGQTLRQFAEDATVTALVHAYRQAGEGLAAAHRAGLVHRDFKPDNAIVGSDGRVRVLDFGLAHEDGAAPVIAGTPRYMAPEQRRGEALTAAVDQYALCVALREAITARGALPRWLEPVLARGTLERASERYPSMDALLRALALDPAAAWRRRALIGAGAIAVAGIVGAFTLGRARQDAEPCEGGAEIIATSWGGPGRAAAAAHLATLGTTYAREAAPRLTADLDGYAARWVDVHRAACRAHHDGGLSPAGFDRRSACLAIRRAALARVGELATTVPADGLSNLVLAAGGLPELPACEDDAALLSPVAPPSAMQAAEAASIAELIARVDVERDAGDTEPATRDADAAVTRARALGYPPLVARALLARGRIELALWRGDRGARAFTAATLLAVTAGDEPLAIEAYARGAWALGTSEDADPAKATDGLALIEALTERVGVRAPFARALLHNNLGSLALARGDRAAARTAFERARREAVGLTGSGAIELTIVLMNLLVVVDDPAVRASIGAELVETRTRLLGAHHPSTLEARITMAELVDDPDRVSAELTPPCVELHEFHPEHREIVGECTFELAWLAIVAGDTTAATAMVTRALATLPPDAAARPVAAAYRLMLAANPSGALAVLAPMRTPIADDAPWWTVMYAADAAVAAALAEQAAHRTAEVDRELATAERLLRRIAAAMPAAALHRRQRAIATLRAR